MCRVPLSSRANRYANFRVRNDEEIQINVLEKSMKSMKSDIDKLHVFRCAIIILISLLRACVKGRCIVITRGKIMSG